MKKFAAALTAMAVFAAPFLAPAHAQQVDPNSPEDQFRAFAALVGAGKRCNVAETLDERMAQAFADQMMGGTNAEARKFFTSVYNEARGAECTNPTLVQLFAIAAPVAMQEADAAALAYLDQGFCKVSPDVGVMRLYATYRKAGMSAKRIADVAEKRAAWVQALKTGCAGSSATDLGVAHSNIGSVLVWDLTPMLDGSCRSDWAKTAGPFDCVYGGRPYGPAAYDEMKRFARQSVRAARAKALALELNTAKSCKAFSAAERAVGEAQMREDARFGLSKFNATSKSLAGNLDPDIAYATIDEVAADGQRLASGGSCADFGKPLAVHSPATPNTIRGEQVVAASGAIRIRQTMDRVAMVAASLPACAALPNFPATKKAADAYVAGMTPQRRLIAAAESAAIILEIDRTQCDPAKLGAPFTATALHAVDALKGKWK
jgi:hypothetical protein